MVIPQGDMMSAQQPEELHQLFDAYVNAQDVDALLTLYEQDCTAVDLEGHPLQGTDNLRTFLIGVLSVVKQIDSETRKILVSGNIALLSSTWRAVLATHDGGMTNITGTSAEVAQRRPDGTWRFLIDDPEFVNISLPSSL